MSVGQSDNFYLTWQHAILKQGKQRRDELFNSQIAGDAKNDQHQIIHEVIILCLA